jgi:uncharacterized protein (TIGR03437 family)
LRRVTGSGSGLRYYNPLPFTVDGISVTVGGAPAPIVAIADDGGYQQINFEVPQEAARNSDGMWTVTASQDGTKRQILLVQAI